MEPVPALPPEALFKDSHFAHDSSKLATTSGGAPTCKYSHQKHENKQQNLKNKNI